MILKKSWILFFLFLFLWEVSSASPLEGGAVPGLEGKSAVDREFTLDDMGSPTNKKPLDATHQRNANFLIEAIKSEDMELISDLSKKELAQVLLHARDLKGGNLFHYMARDTRKSLNPEFLQKLFEGEDAGLANEYETVHEQIFTGLTKILPRQIIGKALKLRDGEGFTPKELARKNQNKPFLKILQKLERKYNDFIFEKQFIFTIISSIGGITGLALGSKADVVGLSLLTASGIALCHASFLQTKKLPSQKL